MYFDRLMIENIFEGLLDIEDKIEYNLITDANMLYDGYEKSRKVSKWKGSTQIFQLNFLARLSRLQKLLLTQTYEISPGASFILHERGKIRPIHAKEIDDRVVAHALVDNVIMPIVRKYIIYDNCASIQGRGIDQQRNRLEQHLHEYYRTYGTNEGFIILGDFTKFYDNIQHQLVYELFKPYISDDYYLWLLNKFLNSFKIDVSYMNDDEYSQCLNTVFNRLLYWNTITPKQKTGKKFMRKSLDIGDQTSQAIGVFFPTKIDNYIKIVKGMRWYGRYMDDFYIISNSKEELLNLIEEINNISQQMGIYLNLRKTYITPLNKRFKFLQSYYWITRSGAVVRRLRGKQIRRMKTKITKLSHKIKNNVREPEDIVNMIRSWMGGYCKYMSKEQYFNIKRTLLENFSSDIVTNDFHLTLKSS